MLLQAGDLISPARMTMAEAQALAGTAGALARHERAARTTLCYLPSTSRRRIAGEGARGPGKTLRVLG